MSHKLISNQSVVYNSETQASGALEIYPEQVTYQNDGGTYHNVGLQLTVKVNGSNKYVQGLTYNITQPDWDVFFAAQTFSSSGEFGKQSEGALYYTRTQLNGAWGLTENDWTYSE